MSFTFSCSEMAEDLVVLSDAASKFLAPRSPHRLKALAHGLGFAVVKAREVGSSEFKWQTNRLEPITVNVSRNWKGKTNNFDPITAAIAVDFDCKLEADGLRATVTQGATVVRILKSNDERGREKVFHFDAGFGGFDDGAGHPPLHLQYHGFLNDIPRVPSIVVHPVDVIFMILLELHQSHWRDHIDTISSRSKLRKLPFRQRERLTATAMFLKASIQGASRCGLVNLQQRVRVPMDL